MAWKTLDPHRTMHNETCKMSFGKPSEHSNCPRCNELKQGAKSRNWGNVSNSPKMSDVYCFSVSPIHSRCTKETNPQCACGKMSYTD